VDSSLETKHFESEILRNSTQVPTHGAAPANEKLMKKVSRNKETYFQQKTLQQTAAENAIRFSSDDEENSSKEESGSRLGESLRKKIEIADRKFAERYPRDHAGSALRQVRFL
jgi:2-methylcitrate dehydratase PrpD